MVEKEGIEVHVRAIEEDVGLVGDSYEEERDLNLVLGNFESPERFL